MMQSRKFYHRSQDVKSRVPVHEEDIVRQKEMQRQTPASEFGL